MKIEPTYSNAQAGDALLLGFDISETQAIGTAVDGSAPGWFFVFEEAYGETHFGMDDDAANAPTSPLDFWDDLDWSHATSGTGFVDLASSIYVDINETFLQGSYSEEKNLADYGMIYGTNSANVAYTLFQKPVRLSIHANDLVSN